MDDGCINCIYCCRADVHGSLAHILPEALGGVTATRTTVCGACNSHVNSRVENPVLPGFAYFRSAWGIQGRRKRPVRVRATIRTGAHEIQGWLNERGEPHDVFVQRREGSDGRTEFSIFGEPDAVEARFAEIARTHPSLRWERLDNAAELQVIVPFELDLAGPTLRRLAAKVALERCAQRWGAEYVRGAEFDDVRRFVLDGTERQPLCGLIADTDFLRGSFNFALPRHAAYLNAHPRTPLLGAVVAFFGLFYFWVVASTRFKALGQTDSLLLEHAQTGSVEEPLLRGRPGDLVLPWSRLTEPFLRARAATIKAAAQYAVEKLQAAADELYGRETGRV